MSGPGRLRVVSGTARGRRLRAPEGEITRPTSDRVREAVFNSLFSLGVIDGARVADLFAGSGALGIEALSRGAGHAYFVESGLPARAVIEENLADLGFRDRATVVAGDVMDSIAALDGQIGLVLADPPYAFDRWPELLDALAVVVAPAAVAVLESDRNIDVGQNWEKMRERTYGGTVITFATLPTQPSGADA